MLLYGTLLIYLPRFAGYFLVVVSLIFMLRLWRKTQMTGYALLALLAALGLGLSLATPTIVSSLGIPRSNIFFAWWHVVAAGLGAFAWWSLYVHHQAHPIAET